jgi:hypothetical protein
MNIAMFYMELVYIGSWVTKLKILCFSDRHTSNISRLVNLKDYRLYGMKSHDSMCLYKHSFH